MEKKSPAPSSAPKRGRRKASPGTKVAKPPAKKAKKTASPKKGGEDVKVEEAPAVSSSVSAATTPRRGGRRGAAAKKEAPAEKPAPTKRGRSASAAKKTSPAPAKKAKVQTSYSLFLASVFFVLLSLLLFSSLFHVSFCDAHLFSPRQ